MTAGVALWCKSNFSFLEGASHPEELVEEAHRLGYQAIAITDRDGVYGVVRAHEKARELGLKLLIGSEVTVDDGSTIVLIATNRQGYANLCQLVSKGRLRCEKGRSEVGWVEVCEHAGDLLALWNLEGTAELAGQLSAAFSDRLFAMLSRHHEAEDVEREALLRERAEAWGLPLVAAPEILYHHVARRRLQDVVTCIRHQTTLSEAGRKLKANDAHGLLSPRAFARLYEDDPRAFARTEELADRCHFSLAELRYRYPTEKLPEGMTSTAWLEKLTFVGARLRYGGEPPPAMVQQLHKELQLIEELDYGGYFLTMCELVEFCRDHRILCQGRGSAASSAVCYCLGITAINPVEMDFLFERFLSRERAEPPDIDLDIEHDRREEVIQFLYEKHGRTHAAMVANVVSYRARSSVRDIGKVLGVAETELDRFAKLLHHYDATDGRFAQTVGLDASTQVFEHLMDLCEQLEGFPRHLSIHPGGFLLGHDAIATLVPVENATMEHRTVIQWAKDDIESLGLFKVDLLGLGSLSHLHRTFDLLKEHREVSLTMAKVPAGDPKTYEMICRADTVGVFQIESRAQMSMLPRLRPKKYYDLVVQVSIVRPGPITGGMVHPYLRRRSGQETVVYPHACLEPVLERTLGVPLFQEQVMRIAMVAADYSPGEADQLRRDMAAWRRNGRMEKHRERLVTRMQKKGISKDFAERVYQQICGFGEYGFPESHAASFALISYVGSYLKAHYPVEFTCGLLNSLPMGFYSAATLVEDAKRHDVEIRPIDVEHSEWKCTLERVSGGEYPFAIRMGLCFVKGLSQDEGHRLVVARGSPSIPELARRSGLNQQKLSLLAEAGALESLEPDRRSALWQTQGLQGGPTALAVDDEPQLSFDSLTPLQGITWDYERSSHSARGHPLGPLRDELRSAGLPSATEVAAMTDGARVRVAGLVICRQRPGTASGVTFMTFEDETGFVNVVVWRDVFEANAVMVRTRSFLGVQGRIQKQDGVLHVMAESFFEPVVRNLPASTASRDFH